MENVIKEMAKIIADSECRKAYLEEMLELTRTEKREAIKKADELIKQKDALVEVTDALDSLVDEKNEILDGIFMRMEKHECEGYDGKMGHYLSISIVNDTDRDYEKIVSAFEEWQRLAGKQKEVTKQR